MGMFDYIHYKCPSCKKVVEEQTKIGECGLNHYYVGDILSELPAIDIEGDAIYYEPAPYIILGEIMEYGLQCPNCGCESSVILHPFPTLNQLHNVISIKEKDNNDSKRT